MDGSLIQGADIVVGGSFFGLTPETLIDAQDDILLTVGRRIIIVSLL